MTDTNAAQVANGKAASDDKGDDWKELTVAAGEKGGDEESPNAKRARILGWQPKEKYRGRDGDWLDADAFIEKVEAEVPVLRERNRTLSSRVAEQEKRFAELQEETKKANSKIDELLDINRSAMDRGYSARMHELETAMDRAAADGDKDAYKAIKTELIEFGKLRPNWTAKKEEKKAEDKPVGDKAAPVADPEVKAWLDENTWFNRDKRLTNFAASEDALLQEETPGMSTADRLAEVKRRTMEKFPEKFENPARKRASAVATPSGHVNGKGKKGRSFTDLDEGAKAAYVRVAARTPGYTKDEYLKTYQWDKA